MKKVIDFNQPGGFPLSTQILEALQEAYKNFNAHGALAGELAIIVGCEVGGGGNVTNGFVHINGELLPFVGGPIAANVAIVEISDLRGFEDGSVKPVIYTRYATFGEGTPSYPWSNFRRPLNLFQLEDRLLKVEKATPIGLVAIWDRPALDIPEGWIEHIDLRGNVPVGHNSGDLNFGSLGNTVGAKNIVLEVNQLPERFIYQSATMPNRTDGVEENIENTSGFKYINKSMGDSRVGQSITNIQPSRIVKFIRFVGFE